MPWTKTAILSAIEARLLDRQLPKPMVAQHVAYHSSVLDELEKELEGTYPTADIVGMGGSGVALKIAAPVPEQPPVEKCLKYPQPMIGQSSPISLADVLDREADALRALHHENIIPLDAVGRLHLTDSSISERDRDVPYYIMPYVDSVELPIYVASPHASPTRLVKLLRQIAAALDYMHRAGFVHLDVKPENIFVQGYRGGEPTALLADFGFCKRVTPKSDQFTMVMVTDGYVHPDLLRLMARRTDTNRNRIRDRVSRNVLSPRFDRFAFGVTIVNTVLSFLRDPNLGRNRTFPTGILRGLQIVALRCCDGHPNELRNDEDQQRVTPENLFQPAVAAALKYQETRDLLRNMNTLASDFREYPMEPEIADVDSTIICLPPRTFAQLTDRVKSTLDSTPVRRLANVSQLALCYHVYPGAAHTRKEHMLGTYATAATLLRHLLFDNANPLCALLLSEKHQRLTLLGALLHDFGHIALLHELEDALPDLQQDTYMREIIDGRWGDSAFQYELDEICRAWDVTRDDIRSMFGSSSDGSWREQYNSVEMEFVRSILDGAIDVDKIDYLQRDALHAGVQYGYGVDVERLERRATSAMWVTLEESRLVPHFRLAAWQSAQPAAEAVISARHNMHAQVYAHRTVRAARAMLDYVTWCWSETECYAGLDSKGIVDRLFRYASQLDGPVGDLPFNNEPIVPEPRLGLRDNLAYGEARIIRWMAAVSGDAAATSLAEALIQRNLYKEVRALDENSVHAFLERAYPSTSRSGFKYRERSAFAPQDWISLTLTLGARVRTFLAARAKALSRPLADTGATPEVLLDVAFQKRCEHNVNSSSSPTI